MTTTTTTSAGPNGSRPGVLGGTDLAIAAMGLRKDFGSVHAVRGIDLAIRQGEIVAFLGPNGAGKTTTIDMILGLSDPTAGTVTVLGQSPPERHRARPRRRRHADGRAAQGHQRRARPSS